MKLRSAGIAALLLLTAVVVACGSDDSSTETFIGANAGEDQALVVRTGETFTVDQFEAAGFKLLKEFDVDTVPLAQNATDALCWDIRSEWCLQSALAPEARQRVASRAAFLCARALTIRGIVRI